MDLRTRAIKGTVWYAGTRLWTQALSWAVTIALARLLTPADYGLFGMAFAVIGFLELFQQMGLGAAIIQRRDLTRQHLDTVFWVVSGISVLGAAVTWAGAGLLAAFYRQPDLIGIARALALILVINALGMVPYNLLTREIDFRRRSLSEIWGVLVGSGVSLGFAWWGYGPWALVWGQLARSAVRNAALVALSGWLPGLQVSLRGSADLFRFGATVASTTLVRDLSGVINSAIIGRLLGSHALGLWGMAHSLGMNPFHKLSSTIINQLSLPVFSRLQEDREQLARSFLKISRYLAILTFPMQAGVILVAPDIVPLLLSERWAPIVPILQILSVGTVWNVMVLPAAPVLTAQGRPQVALANAVFRLVGMALALGLVARFGLGAAAVATGLVYIVLRSVLLRAGLRSLNLGLGRYLRVLAAPMAAAGFMVAVVLAVRLLLPLTSHVEHLARDVVAGVLAYALMLLALDRTLAGEVMEVLRTITARRQATGARP